MQRIEPIERRDATVVPVRLTVLTPLEREQEREERERRRRERDAKGRSTPPRQPPGGDAPPRLDLRA